MIFFFFENSAYLCSFLCGKLAVDLVKLEEQIRLISKHEFFTKLDNSI